MGFERNPTQPPPKAKKQYLPPKPIKGSLTGDTPGTRAGDFAAANGYKRTAAYRKTVRQVYKSQPVAARRAIARAVAKRAAPAPKVTHDDKQGLAIYKSLTPAQRAVIDQQQRQLAVKRLGRRSVATTIARVHEQRHATDVQQLKDLGFLARTRYGNTPSVMSDNRMPTGVVDTDLAKKLHWTPEQLKKNHDLIASNPHALGFKEAGVVDKLLKVPAQTLASGGALAEATYHDPIGVPKKTLVQAVEAVPAAFGGTAELLQHPKAQTKKLVKAYLDRTGETYDQKVKRIRKEGGFADAADVATVLFPVGGPAGEAVKEALLNRTARAGVRVSGDIVKARRAGGLTKTIVGTAKDSLAGRKLDKQLTAAEAGGTPMDAVRHQAAVANRKAGHVVEVVSRRAGKDQAHDVAVKKGRAVYGLKHDQGARVSAATKTINKLGKDEKRALYYATVYGIRTPEQARELLPQLAEKIAAARAKHGVRVTGSLKKSDMLPDLEKILAAPEKHFTPKVGEAVEALRADSIRAGREDPGLPNATTRVRRRYAPLADLLDVHPEAGEGVAAHTTRLQDVAASKGLARPLYFKSERYTGPTDFASRAVGGKRAMAHDRVYGGKNLEIGLQDTTPAQYVRGLARNIKRKHNWNLVANILHAHAIKGLAPASGSTISHLRASVHARGIDEGSIAYWNPGVYREHAARLEHEHPDDERFANAEESTGIKDALNASVVRGNKLTDPHLNQTNGWHVVPIDTLQELERQSTPSNKYGRMADIAKGKASRAILLAGNVPWAGFQVASNAVMTTAATGGRALNPANWLGAHSWWKALSPEEKRNVGGHFGLDTTNADLHQVRLGASTNSDLVNTYRAFKAHPLWHTGIAAGHGPSLSQLNPMELMAAFDRTQNNLHRTVAAYTLMKHEAVKRMGAEMGHVDKAQARVASILQKPAAEQMSALARDPKALEENGERVADWLGDYTTLTATERKVLNRTLMFYPYLRYSLKLVFYTLPIRHPAVTAILAEIGQMHADEIKKLFGADELPWNSGKIYFGEAGNIKAIDLKKANPALNALFDAAGAKNPGELIGMLPPYAGWLADQLTHRSNFADRDWRVNGSAAAYGPKSKDFGARVRGRILLNNVLSLAYPYREANNRLNPGTQGDDSLLFSPRPTKFKGRTTSSKLKAKFAKRQQAFNQKNSSLLTDLVPFIPTPSRDRESAREQKIIKKSEQPASKKKAKSYFGGGSSGSTRKSKPKPKLFGVK